MAETVTQGEKRKRDEGRGGDANPQPDQDDRDAGQGEGVVAREDGLAKRRRLRRVMDEEERPVVGVGLDDDDDFEPKRAKVRAAVSAQSAQSTQATSVTRAGVARPASRRVCDAWQ